MRLPTIWHFSFLTSAVEMSHVLPRLSLSCQGGPSGGADRENSGTIVGVCYAKFDTIVGNTIAYAAGISSASDAADGVARLVELVDARSLQDYCFPDGAHDNMTDIVCAILRIKDLSIPERQDGAEDSAAGGSTSSTRFNIPPGGPVFVTSVYHQKKDAAADRGATQRGVMVFSTRPLFHALTEFFRMIVAPFFDAVPMAEHALHMQFVDALYCSLSEAFSIKTGRAEWDVAAKTKFFDRASSSVDSKGTLLSALDPERCDQRVIRVSVELFPSEPTTDPHMAAGRQAQSLSSPVPASPTSSKPLFQCDCVLPVALPKNTASLSQQVAFGASVKQLMQWLGASSIAVVHFCLLSRVPVLFVGGSANEVAAAVRASILLMQPLEIAVNKFAPYCTLEHVDQFSANTMDSYIALGATNAFVCHKEFPGAVKCDVRTGETQFAEARRGQRHVAVPKNLLRVFDDLVSAARDPAVAECYIRARCVRFNLVVLKQMRLQSGAYYDALCRTTNIVDQPLTDAESQREARATRTTSDSNSDFLLVGDEAAASPRRDGEATRSEDVSETTAAVIPDDDGEAPAEAPVDAALVTEESSVAASTVSSSSATQLKALAAKIASTISMFEETSKKNHQLIIDVDGWYKDMCRIMRRLATDSERWHRGMIDELSAFNVLDDARSIPDLTLEYCPSDVIGSCTSRQKTDRIHRLRVIQDFRERVFLMIDALSKNNNKALLRRANRYVCDLFHVGIVPALGLTDPFAISQQVLLHSTGCKTVWYVHSTKVTASGTLHLTRNYLLFETGAFSARKRHQIVPFDCIQTVAKDQSSLFSTSLRCSLVYSPLSSTSTSDLESGLLLISNVDNSDGFFQLLHALVHRQSRLVKLMETVPPPHRIPACSIGSMFIPRTIPVGLYAMQEQWCFDEVWENERLYPLVGWSSKLMPSDPAKFSDFSLTRSGLLQRDAWPVADGFALVYDWRTAQELREADPSLRGVLSDELMLKYGKVDSKASGRRAAGVDASDDDPTTQLRSPRGGTSTSTQPSTIEYLYNTSWTGIDTFRAAPFLGCTVRRRLWVRVRRLLLSNVSQEDPVEAPPVDDAISRQITTRTVSTSSSDVVESPRHIAAGGVPIPMVEEDDDIAAE